MVIVSPRDLVVVEMRDFLEHSVMLLEQLRFDEAVAIANGGGGGVDGLRHIVCMKCVAPDVKAGRFEKACVTVGRFRDLEAHTWMDLAVLFDRFGGLQYLAVSDVVPVPPRGARLPAEVYDEILRRLVDCPSALCAVLHWWPPEIFSADSLRQTLRDCLPRQLSSIGDGIPEKCRLRAEALAQLEAALGDLRAATQLMLRLRNSEVFTVFRRGLDGERPLAGLIEENVQRLFEIDDREACSLMVENRQIVSVDAVVTALQGCDNRWRHEYLKQLFAKDEVAGQDYHMQMVRLFAEYEPKGLLKFLQASERYPLEDALGVCQARGLLEEEAYLLSRAGRVSEAMFVLLERLVDVRRAVLLASEYQDPKLWETLVSYVLDHPHLLVPLLEHLEAPETLGEVGKDSGRPQPPPTATPAHVLRRLPHGTPVSRVAPSIRRVIDSYQLTASIYSSCNRLSAQETTAQKKKGVDAFRKAALVAPKDRRCAICERFLVSGPPVEWAAALSKPGASENTGEPASARTASGVAGGAPVGASAASAPSGETESMSAEVSPFGIPIAGRGSGKLLPPPRGSARLENRIGEVVAGGIVLIGQRAMHKQCHARRGNGDRRNRFS
eukprot:TRINITY_DN34481_c0_g1_i1.p1 TRINITY_DN34481_c0_g1~~TRINITY_DN34481_c0_g1_i1.p1  ORF type:complete len:611 (+),score=113.32 TRINITY_DN34481_c0_g1_i1:1355-3187(+)